MQKSGRLSWTWGETSLLGDQNMCGNIRELLLVVNYL